MNTKNSLSRTKKKSQKKNKVCENLIICCAGDGSLHLESCVDFHTCVMYYGKDEMIGKKYKEKCNYFFEMKGCKWQLVAHAIQSLVDTGDYSKYTYVWLPDDDISCSNEKAVRLFDAMRVLKCDIGQPSVCPPNVPRKGILRGVSIKSGKIYIKPWINKDDLKHYVSHYELLPRDKSSKKVVRYMSNIEVQCPIFLATFLMKLYEEVLGNTEVNTEGFICSGWGLEGIWRTMTSKPMALIDFIDVVHSRKLSYYNSDKNYDNFYKVHDNNPWVEMKKLHDMYGKHTGKRIKNVKYYTINSETLR